MRLDVKPHHHCTLPADHVSDRRPFRVTALDGTIVVQGDGSAPCPHVCMCGALLGVDRFASAAQS